MILLTVSVCAALATPNGCAANVKLAGLALKTAGARPVPLSATVCVRSASLTVRVPVCTPSCVGANTTLMVQLAGPAS